MVIAEDISSQIDKPDWWKGKPVNSLNLWANARKKVFLLQPLSGASERVFFSDSLRDYHDTNLCYQFIIVFVIDST